MGGDDLLTLQAGALRLHLAPSCGGSIAGLEGERPGGGGRVDWLRPASTEGLAARNPLAMASFPLVPFCNRIRDGRARFGSHEIRMPPNHPGEPSPHPLHGLGWLRPWAVDAVQDTEARLSLEVTAHEAWPWSFAARQHFVLDGSSLHVNLEIENRAQDAMPAGIGHHPYFPHPPGTRLQVATEAMWRTDRQVLPTQLEAGDEVRRLAQGVLLRELDLDNNFAGWSHAARIDWPGGAQGPARHLHLRAQPPLDFFVVYCPPAQDFFCAEPVSQTTDWLNMASRPGMGPSQLGGSVLQPGEVLRAAFSLTPGWD